MASPPERKTGGGGPGELGEGLDLLLRHLELGLGAKQLVSSGVTETGNPDGPVPASRWSFRPAFATASRTPGRGSPI